MPTSALSEAVKEGLDTTITYFKSNIAGQRMDYAHQMLIRLTPVHVISRD